MNSFKNKTSNPLLSQKTSLRKRSRVCLAVFAILVLLWLPSSNSLINGKLDSTDPAGKKQSSIKLSSGLIIPLYTGSERADSINYKSFLGLRASESQTSNPTSPVDPHTLMSIDIPGEGEVVHNSTEILILNSYSGASQLRIMLQRRNPQTGRFYWVQVSDVDIDTGELTIVNEQEILSFDLDASLLPNGRMFLRAEILDNSGDEILSHNFNLQILNPKLSLECLAHFQNNMFPTELELRGLPSDSQYAVVAAPIETGRHASTFADFGGITLPILYGESTIQALGQFDPDHQGFGQYVFQMIDGSSSPSLTFDFILLLRKNGQPWRIAETQTITLHD